jgi:hypothetical protein
LIRTKKHLPAGAGMRQPVTGAQTLAFDSIGPTHKNNTIAWIRMEEATRSWAGERTSSVERVERKPIVLLLYTFMFLAVNGVLLDRPALKNSRPFCLFTLRRPIHTPTCCCALAKDTFGSILGTLHNLPASWSSFIGREREIAEIKQLLATARLVTLTGTGRCGKTRLAWQVAALIARKANRTAPLPAIWR